VVSVNVQNLAGLGVVVSTIRNFYIGLYFARCPRMFLGISPQYWEQYQNSTQPPNGTFVGGNM